MRKLKLQVQMSVDGLIAGPDGEMNFMEWNWDDALKQYVDDLTEPVDCIVLGRKLAEGFIPHWAGVAADPENPEHAAGVKFTATRKVVFTQTVAKSPWDEAVELARGDLAAEINNLKNEAGGDLIAYGGATFVANLIKHDLIDDYHLFVNPSILGRGKPIFDQVGTLQKLSLVKATPFECGIVVLHYRPQRN